MTSGDQLTILNLHYTKKNVTQCFSQLRWLPVNDGLCKSLHVDLLGYCQKLSPVYHSHCSVFVYGCMICAYYAVLFHCATRLDETMPMCFLVHRTTCLELVIGVHPLKFVSDIAVFVLKGDVKLQPTSRPFK